MLTGGGDCPGLTAVLRAVVRKGVGSLGHEFVGYRDGWRGVLEAETRSLGVPDVRGILPRGGTILGSSRTNPLKQEDGLERVESNMASAGVDGLIAIGGEDTLGVATKLSEEGVQVVGVPKTIDNDLGATDYTFGFDTAVNIAMEAVDRLHTTAASHQRIMVVEVMGRYAGWIALEAGISGSADAILIPEIPYDLHCVVEKIKEREQHGANFSVVVVAEGARPKGGSVSVIEREAGKAERLGGVGDKVAREIQELTGKETRVVVLGHLLRGGSPTGYDRLIALGHRVDRRRPRRAGRLVHADRNPPAAGAPGGLCGTGPQLPGTAADPVWRRHLRLGRPGVRRAHLWAGRLRGLCRPGHSTAVAGHAARRTPGGRARATARPVAGLGAGAGLAGGRRRPDRRRQFADQLVAPRFGLEPVTEV